MIKGGARAHSRIDRVVRLDGSHETADVGLFEQLPPTLFLVDGNNLLWRAAHGPRAPFLATDGRDLTPLFRFVTLLRRALGTYGLFAVTAWRYLGWLIGELTRADAASRKAPCFPSRAGSGFSLGTATLGPHWY